MSVVVSGAISEGPIDCCWFSHFPLTTDAISGSVLTFLWWLIIAIPKVPLGWKKALTTYIHPQSIIGVFYS
jgi:hypothetical protein